MGAPRDPKPGSGAGPAGPAPRGVLFLCVQNTARSQMAEGWARRLLPAGVRVWSAGSQPAERVNPRAVAAMREVGVDISSQRPKGMAAVPWAEIDAVFTLCAEEACVGLPAGVKPQAWELPDPAAAGGTPAEVEAAFRSVRDELQRRIEGLARAWRPPGGSAQGPDHTRGD